MLEKRTNKYLKQVLKVFFRFNLVLVLLLSASFVPKIEGKSATELGVKTVVIDAGHGGKDPGNLGTGRYKTTEKHIALNVALKLGEYINKNYPDVKVVYTRKTDDFLELDERTKMANNVGADLFISIHCNSAASKSAYGTETFVMGLDKARSNLQVALKENRSILLEEDYETKYAGFDPEKPESFIMQTMIQSAFRDNSLNLATKIQSQYRDRVGRRDRGVKQEVFYVISYTTMPSILTELGFLTHSAEEDFLNSEDGQVYMASALYRAFKAYKSELEGVEIAPPAAKVEEPEVVEDPNVEKGIWFKVQITSSKKELDLSPKNFKGLEGVTQYVDEASKSKFKYKYVVGKEASYESAVELQEKVRSDAYGKAFIVAFKDGVRISITEAMEASNKKKRKSSQNKS